ncbi:hypothetical protein R1L06_05190 [Stenotrophomonas sp. C4297]|uniref:hypothetical protein n=1 Tax=Stenotrophomonas sp. C4297 TaxID=3077847 RepID=UPI00293CB43F|nr:hypothetical protein [Stenotrophomonas sp. C4297]MDV3510110.1 hypothetical protein [Stenotrophomonas sp. C4297]
MTTSVYQRHLRIQAFKNSGVAVVNGANFANVVATLLYETTFIGWLRRAIHALVMGVRVTNEGPETASHVMLYSARGKHRVDYDYIVDSLTGLMSGRVRLVEITDSPSVFQAFKTIAGLTAAWPLTRGYEEGFMQRLLCALVISRARGTLHSTVAQVLGGADTLVTFCDAHPIENLATQIANSRGLLTITNQHGQYRILDHTNMSADSEAYANFQSHQMLAWGAATVREFEKAGIESSRLTVTGWIKRPGAAGVRLGIGAQCFGVMLNGENARRSNLNLLQAADEIAERLGIGYRVRLHPWSRAADYSGAVGPRCVGLAHLSLEKYLDQVRFSLGHMSGAVVEVLEHGYPVYLLDDGSLASVFRLDGLSWPDAASILNAIEVDMEDKVVMTQRIDGLARWFNDSDGQVDRICSVLQVGAPLSERIGHVA